ncbi:MAG: methylated-DNA--[protein]-cysteine S-methyltransferase [Gammaproteobacteria bacterium]|nr:methylated-DNA--[protein]-cysteine S-methyltransferase [Gammaproteobacteria bacterium]
MTPDRTVPSTNYARIERAIAYLLTRQNDQPSLDEVARHVELSSFHFQRLFLSWAGVTPKEFLQAITIQRAKILLKNSASLLETSLQLGLSGTSRLHDLFLHVEKMTPGEYKLQAQGLTIHWTVAATPVGHALFAVTDRGVCHIAFVDDLADALTDLKENWPAAQLVESHRHVQPYAAEILRRMQGLTPQSRLGILMKGSDLRINVWLALLRVPAGSLLSYAQLAALSGHSSAVRAVASCVAQNSLAFLVPCHRVIRASGAFGEYRWGPQRKQALIGLEQAQLVRR